MNLNDKDRIIKCLLDNDYIIHKERKYKEEILYIFYKLVGNIKDKSVYHIIQFIFGQNLYKQGRTSQYYVHDLDYITDNFEIIPILFPTYPRQ
jgi:hypothetical protein